MPLKLSDEFKVGVLVVLGLLMAIFGYAFIKGKHLFQDEQLYYTVYDKIEGLGISDPVQINGFNVGKVTKLNLAKDNSGRIIAQYRVDEGVQVPSNATARIISTDLLGEKAIALKYDEILGFATNGDTLQGGIENNLTDEINAQIAPIKQKAVELFGSIDSLLTVVKVIIEKGQIENSINNVEKATNQFAKLAYDVDQIVVAETESIKSIVDNIAILTETITDNKMQIDRMIKNLATVSDSVAKADIVTLVGNLNSTMTQLDSMMSTINSGEGTMGKLLYDETFYNNLVQVTASADSLLIDLKENPSRYVHFSVFGKKDKSDKKKKKNTDTTPIPTPGIGDPE